MIRVPTQRDHDKLKEYAQQLVGKRGTILDAEMYEPAKGGGFAIVCSTEHAALKLFYEYRYSKVHIDPSAQFAGAFAVCVAAASPTP